jgi:type IV secretory pathway VirB10-like protein
MTDRHSTQRAALARDAALRRLRRLTGASIASAVALSGAFAGVAASSTHARKLVRRPQLQARSVTTRTPPPLPPAPADPAPEAQSPAPAAQPPAPTSQAPVVVSGGS